MEGEEVSNNNNSGKTRKIPGYDDAVRAINIIQEHMNQLPTGSEGRFQLAYAIGVIKGGFLISDSDLELENNHG
jgi:hypothetical protein